MGEKKKSDKTYKRRKFLTFVGREKVGNLWNVMTLLDGQWFGSDWPYILEEGYAPFHINVSSHLAIYDLDKSWSLETLPKNIMHWFLKPNRRQMGAHLYSTRLGTLQMVYMKFNARSSALEVSVPKDINSIYPVIRNESEPGVQRLILGVYYGKCKEKKNKTEGNRVYHRFDYGWTQAYNCWELTEKMFEEKCIKEWPVFDENSTFLEGKRFAIYVCTSAKLTVEDNCIHESSTTRSLIQQGGLIIVDGQLLIRSVKDEESYSTLEECLNGGLLVPNDPSIKIETTQPVLFLGATDSKFDSICWDLTITHMKDSKVEPELKSVLTLPEGGHFEAIENWHRGVKEIWSRHSYLQLYHSNVIGAEGHPHCTEKFKIPDKSTLEDMFHNIESRFVKCEYKAKLSQQMATTSTESLPREHNFRKLFKMDPHSVMQSKYTSGLSIPPAYPPIEYKFLNAYHYLYLPNNKEKVFTENINDHYIWMQFEKKEQLECCLKYGERIYRLKKEKTILLNQLESQKYDKQLADKKDAERFALCDGVNTRLGADGWIYTHKRNTLAKFDTQYYYRYK